jgi:hypothetical protein
VHPVAQQLLDAQVRYHLDRLGGDDLPETVRQLVEGLLSAAEGHRIEDVVDADAVKATVRRALGTVPSSAAVREIVDLVTEVVHDGPEEPYPLGEVVDRERVEALVDALLALDPVLERALDRLADSPLVGTMASRFMARIAGEVLQANRAMADRVPGLGSLVSLGTSAASRAMGAADKQLETLVGATVGKGGTFAVAGLNRILLETLRDPTTREALLQVWDLLAQESVSGLGRHATREEVGSVVEAAHELVASTMAEPRVAELAEALVDGFLERFGGRTPVELLDDLDLDRAGLVDDLVRLAPGVVDALRESGDLDRIIRSHLEPFFASDEVADLLS